MQTGDARSDQRFTMCLRRAFAMVAISVTLSACAGSFEKPDPRSGYGPAPARAAYEQEIKQRIADMLLDPESARFKIGFPVQAYGNNGLLHGGKVIFIGYVIPVEVNAKNRMGGYVGFKPYYCTFGAGVVRVCSDGYYKDIPLLTVIE